MMLKQWLFKKSLKRIERGADNSVALLGQMVARDEASAVEVNYKLRGLALFSFDYIFDMGGRDPKSAPSICGAVCGSLIQSVDKRPALRRLYMEGLEEVGPENTVLERCLTGWMSGALSCEEAPPMSEADLLELLDHIGQVRRHTWNNDQMPSLAELQGHAELPTDKAAPTRDSPTPSTSSNEQLAQARKPNDDGKEYIGTVYEAMRYTHGVDATFLLGPDFLRWKISKSYYEGLSPEEASESIRQEMLRDGEEEFTPGAVRIIFREYRESVEAVLNDILPDGRKFFTKDLIRHHSLAGWKSHATPQKVAIALKEDITNDLVRRRTKVCREQGISATDVIAVCGAVREDYLKDPYGQNVAPIAKSEAEIDAEVDALMAEEAAANHATEDPDLATSIDNRAERYRDQGKYAEAEPLHRRALAIREKALGPEHPDVAQSLNNLAELYRSQSRCVQAEPLYKRALAIWEKTLGPEHPDVANSLNSLALVLRAQGLYAEAEPLYKRALAIREKALGPEHPDVLNSLIYLAGLYHDQGRYAEAEPLFKRRLASAEKALGPEHLSVATSLNNLARVYRDQGKYAEAEPLYKRALAIRERTFGPQHPQVAMSLAKYADLLRRIGRDSEAVKMEARAKAIRAKHVAGN